MRIGDLAEQTGASVRSLRYYEEQGLLAAGRSPSGQRTYDPDAASRVRLLRRLYQAGLTSATIATLLPCVDHPSRASTRASVALMQREHERLAEQIAQLSATRDQLAALIAAAASCGRAQDGA